MKILSVFKRSMKEQMRSPWVFLLSILMAPVFVLAYYIFFGGTSTVYAVLILNQDTGVNVAGSPLNHGIMVGERMQELQYSDGQGILRVVYVESESEGVRLLEENSAHTLIIIPPDFSETLQSSNYGSKIRFRGDLTNPMYLVSTILASTELDSYVTSVIDIPEYLIWEEAPIGSTGNRTEFDLYVPALSILSVTMMIFQSAMTVTAEVEQGTVRRLRLTKMTSFDLLGGITLTQGLVSIVSVSLTFVTAFLLGFNSGGPIWVAVLVGALTSLSIMGTGLIIACFSKKVSDAFIYANFPMIFLMFFSGSIFPVPRYELFRLMGTPVHLFDFLPTTHAVLALNKVLTFGSSLTQILPEIAALTILSILYFAIGVVLFNRTHLSPE